MKPEALTELARHLRYLDDKALSQFFAVVLAEMQRRRVQQKPPPKSPPEEGLKDCEPIRGY